jgi:hypothetical protein
MRNGAYWYTPTPSDPTGLRPGAPMMVEVIEHEIAVMGAADRFPLAQLHGTFAGPLQPPSQDGPILVWAQRPC